MENLDNRLFCDLKFVKSDISTIWFPSFMYNASMNKNVKSK